MNSITNKIFKNTSINTIGLVATLLITLVVFTQITLKLGLEGMGLVAIGSLFSILGLVSLLDFGVPGALTREISLLLRNGEIEKARELFWSCLVLFFLIGVVVSISLVSLSGFITRDIFSIDSSAQYMFETALFYMFVSHLYQFPVLIVKAVFRGYSMFGRLQMVLVSVELVRAVAVIFALESDLNFDTIIIINAIVPFLAFVLLWFSLPQKIKSTDNIAFSNASLMRIKRLASFIFIHRISASIFNSTDRLLSAVFLGPLAVGMLEICSKFPLMFNKALGLSVSAIVPAVSGLSASTKDGRSQLVNIYSLGFKIYYIAVVPLIIIIMAFTPEILLEWVKISDQIIIDCMRIMCIWCLFVPLQFGGNFLIGIDKKVGRYTFFIASLPIVKLLSILILFPVIGIYAFPVSYVIASLGTFHLLNTMKIVIGLSLYEEAKTILKVIVCSIVPLIVFMSAGFDLYNSWSIITWAAILYVLQILAIMLFVLNQNEKKALKGLIS